MKKFFKEFKDFISRGSVIDLAVGMVIGSAFTAIVNALVNSIIMPLITAIFGKPDVSGLHFILNGAVIPYGQLLQAILNFVLVAFFLFLVVKSINQAREIGETAKKRKPSKAEKAELKERGVNLKDSKLVKTELANLRAEKELANKAVAKPTTEELLSQIVELLKTNQDNKETEETQIKSETAEETK